ncbi:histidine kinase group protein, partial [Stagonosporopsis vannaccii]
MRELATSKLAAAYRLDEVAASVATMQSASTLEDVAQLVLQRSPADADAQYVHFFHEKIPSRMMAECTPLDALDAVVAEQPADASALRTRALTRLFKHDHAASARDLTAAL